MTKGRVQSLIKERGSAIAVFHNFRQVYSHDSMDIYAFFEGPEDVSYYMPELRRRWASIRRLRKFVCSGKPILIEVYKKISASMKDKRTLFFIDKDVDDLVPKDVPKAKNIYVTDVYSIENYLVTETASSPFLVEIW